MPAGNPGGNQPGSNNYYVTSLNTYALKPDVLRETIRQHPGEAMAFDGMMELLGRVSAKQRYEWIYTSRTWFQPSIGVLNNVAAPVAGNPITFRIPPADHTGNGLLVPVLEGDIVWFPDGQQGEVTVVNNSAANITDVTVAGRGTVAYSALAANDRVVVGPNSQEEFHGPRGSISGDIFFESFFSQQIRVDYKISNRAWNASMSWTKMGGDDVWYLADLDDMEMRYKRKKNLAYLNQDPTMTGAVNASQTYMTGLIPFIEGGGQVVNHTPGALVLGDFDTMIDAFEAEMINDTEFMGLSGTEFLADFDDMVRTMMPNGAITYGTQRQLEQDFLNLNFFGVKRRGYSFHFGKLAEFHNPQGMGAPGRPWKNTSLILPMGNTVNALSGASVPKLELCYLADNGGNRRDQIVIVGMAGPRQGNPTNNVSQVEFTRTCDTGTFYKEARCFGEFKP